MHNDGQHLSCVVCLEVGVYLCVCVVLFHAAYVLYYCVHGGVDLMGLNILNLFAVSDIVHAVYSQHMYRMRQ